MAYYDALIAAWNSATQPPSGVTGAAITGGMTTAQKVATINGWTITGAVPTSFYVTAADVLNCVNYAEFKALTATQQSNLLTMLTTVGALLGGSGNVTKMVPGMILDYFPLAGPTIAALTALAKSQTLSWCKVNGYPEAQLGGGGLTLIDASNAGLS